jgi:signal transduction histidine kinase
MRLRTWTVAAVGLVGVLGLTAVFGVITARRSSLTYVRLDELYRHYRDVEVRLHQLRSDVHLSGIFIRDYLLDTTGSRDAEYRAQLVRYRQSNLGVLEQLRGLIPDRGDVLERVETLQGGLEEYWRVFEPVFDWTPAEKASQASAFLKREVVPRREAVLNLAREIEDLNSASLALANQEATRRYGAHLGDMQTLLWQTLGLGMVVALVSVNRFRVLERRAEDQRTLAEAAEARMRILSNEIVATQEEERKKLSRELHDHIGQMLTGLRMELGRIERLGVGSVPMWPAIEDSRRLVDEVMRTVRDLAMGLRPSMLDDFGLQPALEWLVRDFSRRSGLEVSVNVSGSLHGLPDPHRTCVFRTVQEALTNCARHSRASKVTVDVTSGPRDLTVMVQDNGVGIPPARRGEGLGLRGLEERAKELSGTVTIDTGAGTGTAVRLWLPTPLISEVGSASTTG